MKPMQFVRRLLAGTTLIVPFATALAVGASPPSTVATVDPRVPPAAGQPCVVELFHNQELPIAFGSVNYTYAPPPGCAGPWAKVVLKLDFASTRRVDDSGTTLLFAGVPVFQGALPKFEANTHWHAERDLTDLASLLHTPHHGQLVATREDTSPVDLEPLTSSARLLFYRASAATPAQHVPDAVYGLDGLSPRPLQLPHNIERAYLDVFNAAPWWFTCVPDAEYSRYFALESSLAPGDAQKLGIFPPTQGCGGGSFNEIRVSIDGTPAGVAPYFPLVAADANYYFQNALDQPAPGLQMLNVAPYRVDLSPFAAILNEAGPHLITLDGRGPLNAQLLLYLDRKSTRVSGAVTQNTLAGAHATPTVQDTLSAAHDVLQGNVLTQLQRDFTICGFVNTSHGRIETHVHQISQFRNLQAFRLDGLIYPRLRSYQQHLWLVNKTQQHSWRTLGRTVLSDHLQRVSYPLQWRYDMSGQVVQFDEDVALPHIGRISVLQERNQYATDARSGVVRYASQLHDSFAGSHTHDVNTGADRNWKTLIERDFHDNQGSCRVAALGTFAGAVTTTNTGEGCPDAHNHVRWFAHPDGSPDSLGWLH